MDIAVSSTGTEKPIIIHKKILEISSLRNLEVEAKNTENGNMSLTISRYGLPQKIVNAAYEQKRIINNPTISIFPVTIFLKEKRIKRYELKTPNISDSFKPNKNLSTRKDMEKRGRSNAKTRI
jgi:hypothetical protein